MKKRVYGINELKKGDYIIIESTKDVSIIGWIGKYLQDYSFEWFEMKSERTDIAKLEEEDKWFSYGKDGNWYMYRISKRDFDKLMQERVLHIL